jgi:hypothetical protein
MDRSPSEAPRGRDAELRDGAALTEWLAAHGLTGSRDAQLGLAREDAFGQRDGRAIA